MLLFMVVTFSKDSQSTIARDRPTPPLKIGHCTHGLILGVVYIALNCTLIYSTPKRVLKSPNGKLLVWVGSLGFDKGYT